MSLERGVEAKNGFVKCFGSWKGFLVYCSDHQNCVRCLAILGGLRVGDLFCRGRGGVPRYGHPQAGRGVAHSHWTRSSRCRPTHVQCVAKYLGTSQTSGDTCVSTRDRSPTLVLTARTEPTKTTSWQSTLLVGINPRHSCHGCPDRIVWRTELVFQYLYGVLLLVLKRCWKE